MSLAEATRAAAVPPFHAMAMSRLASELEAGGRDVLHLEVGQPSTGAPSGARAAAVRAIEAGDPLGYTNAPGLVSLRRRIVRHYAEWYGVDVAADDVVAVAGASAGFTLAFAASFDAGDRVGVLEPGYPCYRNTLLALGITPVPIPVGPDTRWAPTPELLDAAGPLDGLIIASPSNPTGTVLQASTQAAIAAWCSTHDVQLIADEIYHGIVMDGRAETALSFTRDAIVINSFSKYFSMTGWRLGWMVVPAHLSATIERLQQNLYICAPHVSQVAGTAAFDCQDELDAHVVRYHANRAALLAGLAAAGLTEVAAADGAFYVYADIGHLLGRGVVDSMELCTRWLHEAGVATTPGYDFDLARGNHFVRFSYAGREGDIVRVRATLGLGAVNAVAPPPPLDGLRVLDLSTVLAGPNCARYLGDFGADVIKIERPDGGDSLRNMAWRDPRDGTGLWWKLVNRNKRTVALDLKHDPDRAVFLRLVDEADVLVENFRPGTLERLGLGPEVLHARRPSLVITRVTGFGQTGPYAGRPGFATIAEVMSGLSSISGEPDGQPMLPAIALTDEVTGLVAAFATMVALHSGVGQVVDVSLLESLFQIMGPLISLYRLTGEMQPRLGTGLPYTVPRGTYRCADGKWVGLSASADTVARRVNTVLGVGDDPRFATFAGRMEHRAELEAIMRDWCAARPQTEVLRVFTEAEAAIGPVMDMADIAADAHYATREAIVEVEDTPMQGLVAKLSATPGVLRWQGRALDADGDDIRHHAWG